MHYSYRNNSNGLQISHRNHRGQKEFSQHFFKGWNKRRVNPNFVFSKSILQKWGQNNIRAFTSERKLRIHCQQIYSKIIIKRSCLGFPGGSMAKNLPAMRETWVWSLGWEDPLEKEQLLIPVFWTGEFHGQRSLAGYSPWGHKKSDTTDFHYEAPWWSSG